MGRFVNPDNGAFQVALNSEIYVDKTGLLEYTNRVMDTRQAMICNSRPRRFGKSITAEMLTAYYSRGCDSEKMFESLAIGKSRDFRKYLNRCDVIHFDVQWCMEPAGSAEEVIPFMERNAVSELAGLYPENVTREMKSLPDVLSCIHSATGKKFIVIIDEWDVLIRDEAANRQVQEDYINFLRGMFKGTEPTRFIQLAWLTGILPIKKLKTQSALNNFTQFTMLNPGILAPYIGFTEDEVHALCNRYGRDFDETKRWYDGYQLGGCAVYNPNAVVNLMMQGEFQSYWSQTGTYESIVPLINMDFDGLRAAVMEMLSGSDVMVDAGTFQNDMLSLSNRDDVLTLLIHLGYLGYHQRGQTAFIPNEEIRQEFAAAVRKNRWTEWGNFSGRDQL